MGSPLPADTNVCSPPPPIPLFGDFQISDGALYAIGACSDGAAEHGEIATVVKRINERGRSMLTYYEEYERDGKRLAALALKETKAGHLHSVREAHLRAVTYYALALFNALIASNDEDLTAMASGEGQQVRQVHRRRRLPAPLRTDGLPPPQCRDHVLLR